MESSGKAGGEGEGRGLGLGFIEIETSAEGLRRSEVFHVVKEVLGFVLYMHHQIPSILQQLESEFDSLKEEYKGLEETIFTPTKSRISTQRGHNMRKREVKQGIKKMEKLMNAISCLLSALQQAFDEMPNIQGVAFVLGGSLVRPQHVYQIMFSHQQFDYGSAKEYTKSKVAEALSKKAIRALISRGAGSSSYAGPSKTFLLVKSLSTFNLPQHFLPRRDFQYSKKIKCKVPDQVMDTSHSTSEIANSGSHSDCSPNDVIWFQCRHTIKGLACKMPMEC